MRRNPPQPDGRRATSVATTASNTGRFGQHGPAPGTGTRAPGPERHTIMTADVSRRRFLAYVVAAPTVVAAARWADASPGLLAGTDPQPVPSAPGAADVYDLNDFLTD